MHPNKRALGEKEGLSESAGLNKLQRKPPAVVVEGIMKGESKYSKAIAMFVPLGAAPILKNAGEEMLSVEKELAGRKAILVYENGSRVPSYLILRDSLQLPPEVVVEANGKMMLLTLEQAPVGKSMRDIVYEKVAVGNTNVVVFPIMVAMPIMYIIQRGCETDTPKKAEAKGILDENDEIWLYGTDKKSTVGNVVGSGLNVSYTDKMLLDMVPERYKGMVPQRLRDKKFRFMLVEGNKNGKSTHILFTEGNHLATVVDFVPQMLALKPGRVVARINGCEWYGAEISSEGVKGVRKVLGFPEE
ncbi:MAG: hypothetical protein N3G76_01720 [Candidatus Micrarchaeota archaeon]|nr:hypothetical protein [Candidatus Micrarchaeota archaeon]